MSPGVYFSRLVWRLSPAIVIFGVLFYPAHHACASDEAVADVAYQVTVVEPSRGVIDVVAVVRHPLGSNLVLMERDVSENIRVSGIRAKDGRGNSLKISTTTEEAEGFKRLSSRKIYEVESKETPLVTVAYSVEPGTFGKHGHMGYLDKRFGLVYGHLIFLAPASLPEINRITVSFRLPEGWGVVAPWKRQGDIFVIDIRDDPYGMNPLEPLGRATIGLGSFTMCQEKVRNFNIKVYNFAGWSDEHKKIICENIFWLARYQLDLFGVDASWDYMAVFVPNGKDGQRIFGGSSAWGQGFEMEKIRTRQYELFSHRLHHALNAYDPLGYSMEDPATGWFIEGTASYYEIKALASREFYPIADRVAALKNRFIKPPVDIEVSQDYSEARQIQDRRERHDVIEYLHYCQAPTVTYWLDEKIKKDTAGEKSLDEFIKYIYAKYGLKKGAVKLKEELALFFGIDFTDFFRRYVEAGGAA